MINYKYKESSFQQQINITFYNNILDASIIELSKWFPLLHTINLNSCTNITDSSRKSLALNCHYLKGHEYDQFR